MAIISSLFYSIQFNSEKKYRIGLHFKKKFQHQIDIVNLMHDPESPKVTSMRPVCLMARLKQQKQKKICCSSA